jgi:hypothetical protein
MAPTHSVNATATPRIVTGRWPVCLARRRRRADIAMLMESPSSGNVGRFLFWF